MKEINADIKSGKFKRTYLLFGEESYLVRNYTDRLVKAIVPDEAEAMNFDMFEGKDFSAQSVMDAAETLPFLNKYRLVLLKDTGLFDAGRKDDSDALAGYISQAPESTVIVFSERKADKRNRLYKGVAETGHTAEFSAPPEHELIEWMVKLFKNSGKTISKPNAVYLLRTVAHSMEAVHAEAEKLVSYKGDETEIIKADIDAVCIKALETRIFDLTDAIGNKKGGEALDLYSNMILMKQSPVMILTMIARQFKMILQCGLLSGENKSIKDIAAELGLRSFVVSECLRQSGNFKADELVRALSDCLETDISIKTGKLDDRTAVEILIIKHSGFIVS